MPSRASTSSVGDDRAQPLGQGCEQPLLESDRVQDKHTLVESALVDVDRWRAALQAARDLECGQPKLLFVDVSSSSGKRSSAMPPRMVAHRPRMLASPSATVRKYS